MQKNREPLSCDMKEMLTFKAELKNLESFTGHVYNFAASLGFSNKQLLQIKLAVEEIIVNIIRYAYPESAENDIKLSCSKENPDGIRIVVVDFGIAFDPLAQKDPDVNLELEERTVGGLGIYLTKKVMDEVFYNREDGKNVTTLIKRQTV